jgi:pyruvate kinase
MTVKLPSKRTKIVATIGPASYDEDIMRGIIRAGVNVARINFSHGEYETHAKAIATIRRIAQEEGVVLAILGDLQGPKLRLGKFEPLRIVRGDTLTLTSREDFDQAQREVPLPHPELIRDVYRGQRLLLDDGEIELMVLDKPNSTDLLCEVIFGSQLKSNKGISAPDSKLTLPAITPKDRQDLLFALEQQIDWIAMSFVRHAEDIKRLRYMIEDAGHDIPIVAKIEKPEALENIEDIISEADGVMVARGDLGVETSSAAVPIHQKRIIKLCNAAGKPVITATQMLDSMIRNPRPTRAEASDVANAIFDGTDAVMLSGESASGEYPIEAVEMMATIAQIAENQLHEHQYNYAARIATSIDSSSDTAIGRSSSTADAVSHATVTMAERVGARLIVCSTWTGYTARRVARERPLTPIVCITPNPKTYHRLALVWGVTPVMVEEYRTIDEMFSTVEAAILQERLAEVGDRLAIISGVPFGAAGATNFVKIHQL